MSDYVSRAAVLEAMLKASTPAFDEKGKPTFLVNYVGTLENLSSADVVEVKHGKWERIESDTSVDFRCSACHRYRFHNGEMLRKYKFCPNCGADMRERKETDGNDR